MPPSSERLLQRFLAKVEFTEACWLWHGASASGYGRAWDGQRVRPAHGLLYEWTRGVVPRNLELDHICRNPLCVRPDHLEAVSHRENVHRGNGWAGKHARQTHCLRGHALVDSNIYRGKTGGRRCKTCADAANRHYYARRWRCWRCRRGVSPIRTVAHDSPQRCTTCAAT